MNDLKMISTGLGSIETGGFVCSKKQLKHDINVQLHC